jgi:hypothetical protein
MVGGFSAGHMDVVARHIQMQLDDLPFVIVVEHYLGALWTPRQLGGSLDQLHSAIAEHIVNLTVTGGDRDFHSKLLFFS